MQKVRIRSDKVAEPPPGLWSNCVRIGQMVYIAGLTARDHGEKPLAADEYGQARVIFQKIENLVTAAGGSMDDVVKLTVFVTNIAKNTDVWRARKEFFSGDFPACSLVEVKGLARPDILVEIEGVACLGCSSAAA